VLVVKEKELHCQGKKSRIKHTGVSNIDEFAICCGMATKLTKTTKTATKFGCDKNEVDVTAYKIRIISLPGFEATEQTSEIFDAHVIY